MNSLLNTLKNAVQDTTQIDLTQASITRELASLCEEFNLAPDEYVDVKRMPSTVTDLESLKTYLVSIRDKLTKIDDAEKKGKADVVKNGELKLYKLCVCCLHGLSSYLTGGTGGSKTIQEISSEAINHARANKPVNLGANGSKLWESTFAQNAVRTKNIMTCVVIMAKSTLDKANAAAAGGGGGNSGNQTVVQNIQTQQTSNQGSQKISSGSGKPAPAPQPTN